MSPALQAKLLHVLQDGALRAARRATARSRSTCGSSPPPTATWPSWWRAAASARTSTSASTWSSIAIPPLRERDAERADLIDYLLRRASARYGKPPRRLSNRLLRALERHSFPGNVRELENLLKRIVVLESEEPVLRDLLAGDARRPGGGSGSLDRVLAEVERSAGELPLREVARRAALEAERETIERALYQSRWNRKQAARLLGVSYKTLLLKIRECGLEAEG